MAELRGATHVTCVARVDPELGDRESLGPAFGELLRGHAVGDGR